MRSFVALALFAWCVGYVAADTCAAEAVLTDCLSLETPQLDDCEANDWNCLCTQANNVLTCYNNCPSDPGAFGAQQVKISYCNAAAVYGTTTSTTATSTAAGTAESTVAAAPSLSTSGTPSSSSSSPVSSGNSNSDSSPTSSAAASTQTSGNNAKGAAAGLAVEGSRMLAAMILGLGVVL